MSILKGIVESGQNGLTNTDLTFIDADTLQDKEGNKLRLKGINAPEVQKIIGGQLKKGTAGGTEATTVVQKLANDFGYNNVKPVIDPETGEPELGAFGRPIVDLVDSNGQSFTSRLLSEGVLGKTRYTDNIDGLTAELGELRREQASLQGTQANTEWDKARLSLEEAMLAEGFQQYGFRQTALDEVSLAQYQSAGLGHLVASDNVQVRDYRREINNDSANPLSDAWDTGLIGVQESAWGMLNLLGESTDWDLAADIGEAGVERARTRIADRGQIITDYKDVEGFGDAVEYITNNAALSLPYMGITVAATVAAPFTAGVSLTAPAAIYAGQTWNEQEGENKNAAIAIGSGVLQAAFDRLGIGLVFKGAGKAPRDLMKAGVDALVKDGMTKEAAEKTILAASRKELAGFVGETAKVARDQLKAKAAFKNLAGRIVAGAGGEGATEVLQETTAYLAAHNTGAGFNWQDLYERQMQAFVAGSALGGAFSIPSTAVDLGAWADVAVRQAPADAKRLSLAGKHAEQERSTYGRVSSIQENNQTIRTRAAQAGPNAHPTLEERVDQDKTTRKDRTTTEKLVDAFHAAPSLWRGATRYIFDPDTLEKSRTARMFADAFGGQLQRTFSGSNYENTKHHLASIYRNLVPIPRQYWASRGIRSRKAVAEESVKMYSQIQAAIDPKTKELNWDALPDDVKPLAEQLLSLGDRMHADQSRFNPDLGYQKNYLLRYKSFDKQKIHKNKQAFADLLKKNFKYTDAEAIELANRITDSADVNDFADILEGTGAAGKPGAHKERSLNLSEHKDFQDFMEQDIFANVANAAKSAARFQAYQEFVGDNNSNINQMLAQMEAEGIPPEKVNRIAAQMKDYLAAESGNYKRAESAAGKRLERVQRNLMTWMTIAGLPLATISSFVEAALVTKGMTKSDIFGPDGLQGQGEKIGKAMWDKFGEAVEHDKKLEGDVPAAVQSQNILDKLGYTTWDVGSASTTSTANKVGATEVSHLDTKLLDNYFRATGLTGWTNFTRTARAAFAGDFLKNKLELIANSDPDSKTNEVQEAEEQLRNYGLDVDTAVQNYLEGQPLSEAQLREFQFNWINDAVVLPQAANRPLIYQDPRFALFTQFQGFISAFTANQIPKMWGEYVKRGTPALKYNAFATMATMIMLGFASQYLKDLLKYGELRKFGPDDHPYLNTAEYLQRGVRSSGLLGTGERVLDQFFPIYEQRSRGTGEWLFNTTTGESPSLGFAKRMIGGVGSLVTGDVERAAKEAVRATPLGPFNFIRDAAGEAGANWNFKGE